MTRKPRPTRSSPTRQDVREVERIARGHEAAGRLREAEEAYRRVTAAQPRNIEAWCRRGRVLRELGEYASAKECLERALRIDPKHAESNIVAAVVHRQLHDIDGAIACYTRAAWAAPGDPRPHTGLASIYERMHRLEEADASIARALEIDPASAAARVLRARVLRRRGKPEEAAQGMRALLAEEIPDESRFRAGFELSRCLQAMGACDEAFDAAAEANRVQAGTPSARGVDDSAWLRLIRDGLGYAREHFDRWAGQAPDGGPAPVLLVGFPRSGTTLTEQILAAHPAIAVSDERLRLAPSYVAALDDYDPGAALAAQLDGISAEGVEAGRRAYWAQVEPLLRAKRGARVIVDKNPMQLVSLGGYSRFFPGAKVIVAIRDPRDVCLSCFMQEFIANPANVHFFTLEGTLEMYRKVMDVWLAQREILRLPIFEWRYEDVTSDFEGHARRLIEFLGLEWSDEVLRFHERPPDRYISTPSYEAIARPVHAEARGKWRRYEQRLAPIMAGLEPYVRALGYSP